MHGLVLVGLGLASWYSTSSSGARTASGELLRDDQRTCAMRFVPIGTPVLVINVDNGRRAWCRVNDRGPFVPGRVIDVTPAMRDALHMGGIARVRVYRHACWPQPVSQTCAGSPTHCHLSLPPPARCR